MQILESRIFKDFPRLRLILTHGGGNVPFQEARYRALCLMNKWEPFETFLKRLYFDTTVYGAEAMQMLITVVGADNILFASEMLGGVNAVDPRTGRMFDDNQPLVEAISWLDENDRMKIFELNARKVYPRLDAILDRRAQSISANTSA
jgi:4-oxalmesaconate hydratase